MIAIRLKSGMGNQMFQYAFAMQMAALLETEFKIDLSSLLDRSKQDFVHRNYDLSLFHIKEDFVFPPKMVEWVYKTNSSTVTRWVKKWSLGHKAHIREKFFHFDHQLLEAPIDKATYEGWFQSYKYFENIESQVRSSFTFRQPILDYSASLLQEIKNTQSICLNVRRTDFLKVETLNTTNKRYFLEAAEHLASQIERPSFYVFSDDVAWCRDNITLPHPTHIVDHQHKGYKFGNYMQLMKSCKHFIIPNSSFAWWAVWLNENVDKLVVAPKRWFNDDSIDTTDLVPAHWTRI